MFGVKYFEALNVKVILAGFGFGCSFDVCTVMVGVAAGKSL